jgi:KipI family sensor histidine kinase inhibitor
LFVKQVVFMLVFKGVLILLAIHFSPVGDCALSATFGETINPMVNKKIRQVLDTFSRKQLPGIIEMVPTYCSLLVQYDPLIYTYKEMCTLIKINSEEENIATTNEKVRVIELPTVYGGEYGPDLGFVSKHTKCSVNEVIKIHSGTDYLVYMLGFIPGFTYLGGMNPRLDTPRLKTPRTLIPAGSVGIAGSQTGTYPSDSPGGWQIIGRTPLCLYDGNKKEPTLLKAGDYVRYVPINEEEYLKIKNNLSNYKVVVHILKEEELRVGK